MLDPNADPLASLDPRPGGRPLRALLDEHFRGAKPLDDFEPTERARVAKVRNDPKAMSAWAAGPPEAPPTEGERVASAAFAAALQVGGRGVYEGPAGVVRDVVEDLREKKHDATTIAGVAAARPAVVERLGRELAAEQAREARSKVNANDMDAAQWTAHRARGYK